MSIEQVSPSSLYGSIWPTIYHINKLVTMGDQRGLDILDTILDLGRKAKATDERDKVYGLLGLLSPELSRTISPNYASSNSKVEVFREFAQTLLQSFKRLDAILSWCSHKAPNLPSWIPDWTTQFSRNHVQWLKRRRACGSVLAQWSISSDNQCLRCKGFIVDSVQSIGASQSENIPYGTECHKQPAARPDASPANRYESREHLSAALRRALTFEIPGIGDRNKSIFEIYWIDWERHKGGLFQTVPALIGYSNGMRNITTELVKNTTEVGWMFCV